MNPKHYLDLFVFPILHIHLDEYRAVAEEVGEIWKEYGAIDYVEFLGDDLHLEGTRSFVESVDLKPGEVIIFGWVTFPSKDIRDHANAEVPKDPRMDKLVAPLTNPERLIFDARRMVYGGFSKLG